MQWMGLCGLEGLPFHKKSRIDSSINSPSLSDVSLILCLTTAYGRAKMTRYLGNLLFRLRFKKRHVDLSLRMGVTLE